jgi:alkyl sulfatase BDS1-like metallo-beta-lactamase superfamily hydrolase
VTINEIHNVYEVPKGLQDKWYRRGYHGSPEHNSRGVIQRYLGFWDCNEALAPGRRRRTGSFEVTIEHLQAAGLPHRVDKGIDPLRRFARALDRDVMRR